MAPRSLHRAHPFSDVEKLHRRALTTILLTPDRYARHGQFTQRIFEAVLAGCLPLGPANIRSVNTLVPRELIVDDGNRAANTLDALSGIAGTPSHAQLIDWCLRRLDIFRLSHQLNTLDAILTGLTGAPTTPAHTTAEGNRP